MTRLETLIESSSTFSIRAFRADPLIETRQHLPVECFEATLSQSTVPSPTPWKEPVRFGSFQTVMDCYVNVYLLCKRACTTLRMIISMLRACNKYCGLLFQRGNNSPHHVASSICEPACNAINNMNHMPRRVCGHTSKPC